MNDNLENIKKTNDEIEKEIDGFFKPRFFFKFPVDMYINKDNINIEFKEPELKKRKNKSITELNICKYGWNRKRQRGLF